MAEIIDRRAGEAGELALRRVGEHFEIIANGVFLMDTRNGESERILVTAAAEAMPAGGSMLIGGLGVGFSLRAALEHPSVGPITVVERESVVIAWNREVLGNGAALAQVRCVPADLVTWLGSERFAAICLDIDNGPEWTVTPSNSALYGETGLARLADALTPGGVLAVWSASASQPFEHRLRERFGSVKVLPIPVPRGEPDVVYLAHGV